MVTALLLHSGRVLDNITLRAFTIEMGVTSRSPNLENTIADGQERVIEGFYTTFADDNLRLTAPHVKFLCDGGGCWFIDDTEVTAMVPSSLVVWH